MRRGIGAGIITVLLLAICTFGTLQAATPYTDPDGAFSLAVPDGYAVIPKGPIPAFVTFGPADSMTATVSIDAEAIPNNSDMPTTLDSLVADLEAVLASNYGTMTPGVEPVQTLTLGGEDARRVDFVQAENGIRYHGVVFFTFHLGMLWSIIVRAEPKEYDAVIQQMNVVIGSFTFLNGTSGMQTSTATVIPTGTSMPPPYLRRLGGG